MFSILDPTIVYADISPDIKEHDIDVVSDLWNMDGREVYRGSRDPQYTHANVYWLYDEDFDRIGLAEHDLQNHANMRFLWFEESEFGTLLQESKWKATDESLWSILPDPVYSRFVSEGWLRSPMTFLEECLDGPFRVVTPSMLIRMPSYYSCDVCGKKSFKKFHDSQTETVPLDFVSKEKVVFIDDDFMIHMPPLDTCVWVKLRLHDDDSLPEQEPEQEPELPHLESPPEPLPLVETPEQQE
jgi:hypothetical protein